VEAIESWLLIARAVGSPGHGSLHAENERRSAQKLAFYDRPPTREDVEQIALPTLRRLSAEQLDQVRSHSRSFDGFAKQVLGCSDDVTEECR
jgi:hypothetical protein